MTKIMPWLRCVFSVTPRQEFVDPINLVIGNAAEDVRQSSLRGDAVELGDFPTEQLDFEGQPLIAAASAN
jgi:hypothetical protein